MTCRSCYYSSLFFLMIIILLLLLCHNNTLMVHGFPNLLIQSEIGCMTELSVDEVIMNNQVVPYKDSKEKDVKIAYRISEEDEWIVPPTDNNNAVSLDSIPTTDIKLKLVLPDSLKGVQYVVEIMEAGSESAASFPNGGCEGNIRDSEKVPTKRGKEKGISLKITDLKKEVKVLAGWATGHSAVSLTEPIIFKLAGGGSDTASAAAAADGVVATADAAASSSSEEEKNNKQQQQPKEEGQPPKPLQEDTTKMEGSPPKPQEIIIEKCEDIDIEHCADWTSRGECDNNVIYMLKHCRKSCQVCFDHPTVEQLRIMQEKEQKLMDALKELEEKEKKREQAQQEENERIMEEEHKAQQIEMAQREQQAKEIREKTEKDRLDKERLQKDKADIEEMERQALERKERLHREEIFQQKKEDSLRKRKDKVKNEPLKKKKTTKKHAAHHHNNNNNNNNNKFVDEKIHQLGDKIEEYGDVLQEKMDEFGHKIKNTKLGKNIDSKIHKIKHNNKLIQKANRLLHEDGKYDHGKNKKDTDILEKVLTNKITQKIIYNYDDDSYGGGQTYDTDQHIVATIVYIISLIGTVMCCSFISNNKYSSYNKSHVT